MGTIIKKLKADDFKTSFMLLIIIFISQVLISPKWNIGIFVLVGLTINLRYFRNVKWWQASLLTWFIWVSASLISNIGVSPFPPFLMIKGFIIGGAINLLPFLIDKFLRGKFNGIISTLIFPATAISVNIFSSTEGTFGHIAYTMVDFNILMQLTSVTGIWGIAFIIYWFASVVNFLIENANKAKEIKKVSFIYFGLLTLILVFGAIRLQVGESIMSKSKTVKLAAITSENKDWMGKTCEIVTGEKIVLPKEVDINSDKLLECQAAAANFFVDHNNPKFKPVHEALSELVDEVLSNSQLAVDSGAKAILLSEGLFFTFEDKENVLIEKVKNFADENEVYFFLAMATIHPEKMMKQEPFIGNKVLTINPKGEVIDVYYKNVPVEIIEPSFPGDGIIDVIETPYGKLSPIICYDADFPKMMRQTGKKGSEVIMVPTGDWYSISPYHSKIGAIRCIENGVSMFKSVSNGLSIAANPYGQIIAKDDFFEDDYHVLISEVPIKSVNTIYSKIGDVIILISQLFIVFIIIYYVRALFVKENKKVISLKSQIKNKNVSVCD